MGAKISSVSGTRLPNPGNDRDKFKELGFHFYHNIDGYGIMMEAELPPSWGIHLTSSSGIFKSTKHYSIIDNHGYEWGTICWASTGNASMRLLEKRGRQLNLSRFKLKNGIYRQIYWVP